MDYTSFTDIGTYAPLQKATCQYHGSDYRISCWQEKMECREKTEQKGKRQEIKYINKDLIPFPSSEATKLRRRGSKQISPPAYCCLHEERVFSYLVFHFRTLKPVFSVFLSININ